MHPQGGSKIGVQLQVRDSMNCFSKCIPLHVDGRSSRLRRETGKAGKRQEKGKESGSHLHVMPLMEEMQN